MVCSLSKLSEQELREIHALERDLDKSLLAFSCHDLKLADVTEEELSRIKGLEKELGVSLLAVRK